MKLMEGKKGIVFGVSNKRGIAYGIAKALHDQGAEIAFPYFGEVMEGRVRPIAEEMNSKLILSCDVNKEEEVETVFKAYQETYGELDFLIHAIAFANREDLKGDFSNVSREGFDLALGTSAYSFITLARAAKPFLKEGSSLLTLTYLGGERVVPHYNVMGVAKAALECVVRYLASELGPQGVRVNGLSAGPVKTLAAKGIGGFDHILRYARTRAPLKRNVTLEEVGGSGLFLTSPLSTGVTGEVLHVDCGFHSVAVSMEDIEPKE